MLQPRAIFAVDGGATKTVARLHRPDGTLLASHRAGPCNLYQDPDGGITAIAACWQGCVTRAGGDPVADVSTTWISAGLAGVGLPAARARFFEAHARFGRTLLSSDGYTAAVGAFADRPGALLALGTGSVGCRLDTKGGFTQLGGWGFPAGDRGGGAWLGLQCVTLWLEHLDGISVEAASTLLWQRLAERIGAVRPDILAWLRAATPGEFASLAPVLLQSFAEGCPTAAVLLAEAGWHLAQLGRALADAEALPLVLTGGLAAALAPHVEAGLHRLGTKVRIATGIEASSLDGAFRIAVGVRPPQFMGTAWLDADSRQ